MKKIQGIFASALCAAILTMPAFAKCDGDKAQAKGASSCCAAKQMSAKEKADHCATKDKAQCEMKGAKAANTSKTSGKTAKVVKTEKNVVKETSSK